jgi:REP element-mobilizing transposase RayT
MRWKNNTQFRLRGYDYSQNGYYFVTVCTHNRGEVFGRVYKDNVLLSNIGIAAHTYWSEIPAHFKNVELDDYIFMPDHMHGIIVIRNRTCRQMNRRHTINRVPTIPKNNNQVSNNPMQTENWTLGEIIRQYKARTTFHVRETVPLFRWQKRFHDRIIRNEKEYWVIKKYIQDNPKNFHTHL